MTGLEHLAPHNRPMLLPDRLDHFDAEQAVALAALRPGNVFLENGVVPAAAGLEYMAQTCAVHGAASGSQTAGPVKAGFLLGSPKLTSYVDHFTLGTVLRIQVHIDWQEEELIRYRGAVYNHLTGTLLQEAVLSVFQPKDVDGYLQNTGNEGDHG